MPEKVVIIGFRPALLTAAIYAARATTAAGGVRRAAQADASIILPRGNSCSRRRVELPRLPEGISGPADCLFRAAGGRFGTRIVTNDGLNPDVSTPTTATPTVPGLQVGGLLPGAVQGRRRGRPLIGPTRWIVATGATANWLGRPTRWPRPDRRRRQRLRGLRRRAALFPTRNWPWWGATRPSKRPLTLTKFASRSTWSTAAISFGPSASCKSAPWRTPSSRCLNSVVVDVLGAEASGPAIKDTVNGHEREIPLSGLFLAIGPTPPRFSKGKLDLDSKGFVSSANGGPASPASRACSPPATVPIRFIIARRSPRRHGFRRAIDAEAGSPSRGMD